MFEEGLELLDENELMQLKKQSLEVKQALESKPSVAEAIQSANTLEWFSLEALPSEDKVYPKGAKFAYRKYTYEELLAINNRDLKMKDKYAVMLKGIKSVGTVPIDVRMLTFDDFKFICTTRKLEAFGTTQFEIPYVCPFCGTETKTKITMADITFDSMQAKSVPARVKFNQYPDIEFKFMPVTVGDILWLMNNDVYFKRDEDGELMITVMGNYVVDVVAILARQCITHSFEEAYELLAKINTYRDVEILQQLQTVFDHGIMPHTFKCQARSQAELPDNFNELSEEEKRIAIGKAQAFSKPCGETITLRVDGGDTIILPFREESNELEETGIFFD